MLARGGGSIVINGSIAAMKAFPNHPAYCASKGALVPLVKQLALDYGPRIRANLMCPGPVDTPLLWDSAKAFPDPAVAVQNAGNRTALKRLGQPADIASLALFLASDDSSWITGTAFTIDGGALVA
jgi:NAD(P)-dependent dehydrogenase (short-subunit alcohol dehydrogenase family)